MNIFKKKKPKTLLHNPSKLTGQSMLPGGTMANIAMATTMGTTTSTTYPPLEVKQMIVDHISRYKSWDDVLCIRVKVEKPVVTYKEQIRKNTSVETFTIVLTVGHDPVDRDKFLNELAPHNRELSEITIWYKDHAWSHKHMMDWDIYYITCPEMPFEVWKKVNREE